MRHHIALLTSVRSGNRNSRERPNVFAIPLRVVSELPPAMKKHSSFGSSKLEKRLDAGLLRKNCAMSLLLFRGVNCCQPAGKHAHCRARTPNSPRKHRFPPQNRKPSFFHSQRSGESTKIQPALLINALFTHKRSNTANLITMSQSAKASASTFDETLTLPRGFRFAGIACGLKASGKKGRRLGGR